MAEVTLTQDEFMEEYFREVKSSLDTLDKKRIIQAASIIIKAYKSNKKVFILGNGGSASTASHFACDLGKGTLQRIYDNSEKRLRVISLTDNVAVMTAYANDVSYDEIFVQQLRNLIEKDDVVIAISGSGNSKNVIKALAYANICKAKTIGLLGFKNGGKAASLVTVPIIIQSRQYGPIEDVHGMLCHLISSLVAKVKNTADSVNHGKSANKAVPFN